MKYTITAIVLMALIALSFLIGTVRAEAPVVLQIKENKIDKPKLLVKLVEKEEIIKYIHLQGSKWGLEDKEIDEMIATIQCESGFNVRAYNGSDRHATSIGSLGISQFSQGTIDSYSKKAGVGNDPYNYKDAISTMAYMFSIGEQGHWSCWKKLGYHKT